MNNMMQLVKADYLQRTRSYAFLVTLVVAVYGAYVFIPSIDASYITLRVGSYVGNYNSAWVGSATAMLTSTFLFLFGYFLVNSGISRDISTGVGQIIAATSVSNFKYLWSKTLSNFLVLLTIVLVVLLMSIGLLIFRNGWLSLELSDFLLPYLFILVPSIFVVSIFAVLGEVLLVRSKALQYLLYFLMFNVLFSQLRKLDDSLIGQLLDPTGSSIVTGQLQSFVRENLDRENNEVSAGFIFGKKDAIKRFKFQGLEWSTTFLLSRLAFAILGIGLLYIASLFFHRFDIRERAKKPRKRENEVREISTSTEWQGAVLPKLELSFGIVSLIRVEFLLLIRKGSKWLWIPNLGLLVAMTLAPIAIAHQMLLPILWFLQVGRIADIATKEVDHGVHYFTFGSLRPLTRLLPAQILSVILLLLLLSMPLFIRYTIGGEWQSMVAIISGILFIVGLALFLGQLSGGRKLYEVLFFMLTYANLNRAPEMDYFGGINVSVWGFSIVTLLAAAMYLISVLLRKLQMSRI